VFDDEGVIRGVLPLFLARIGFQRVLVSMPLRDRGGILADNTEVATILLNNAQTLMQKYKCHSIIVKQYDVDETLVVDGYHSDPVLVSHRLCLEQTQEILWKNLTPQARNKVRQAEKSGVRVEIGQEPKDIDVFYDLFVKTRHALGVPVYPKKYFDRIAQEMLPLGQVKIAIAYLDHSVVAAKILFVSSDRIIDGFAAWSREKRALRANDALQWQVIKWSQEHHYKWFDFGADSSDQASLIQYKQKWGSQKVPVYNMMCHRQAVSQKEMFNSGQSSSSLSFLRATMRMMPQTLFKLVSKVAVRYYA
jgi:hypothetical protein